ncbi:MAG: 1-(5-phosphoribosyl)-5-[(5-phosphoribosylamino)methylideneamino]imidazole-4-carboxamide isomerase [Deltaproteobacteria bacterium]|nr:MAG: 1-(5-phosphoribosyl)-5-[(5-phosphoribosylamino)methylideneamino]imidazole-4-carboxamide isomerase [Deltaproteobacteria bacterium]
MILLPAVDIKDGQCVRLKQGIEDQVTVFDTDPVAVARQWAEMGARWLHVIDLDGAFSGLPRNIDLITAMCSQITIPIQLGGGIRDLDVAGAYLDAGIARLIIGTVALEDPDVFANLCKAFPRRIGVSLDAKDGKLKTRGWVEDAGLRVEEVVSRLEGQGASFFIYTDIARDGMQSGVNIQAMKDVLTLASVPVLAAGGIATIRDVQALYPLAQQGLQGVITGKAIYAGTLDVRETLAWLEARRQGDALLREDCKRCFTSE